MKGFNSVGDLSRFAQLRQSNAALKSRLAVLSKEVATGQKSDLPAALGGNMGRLAQVQTRLALFETFGRNAALAQSEQDGIQTALQGISKISWSRSTQMLSAAMMNETSLDTLSNQIKQDLHSVVGMINTDVGGRYMLSGTAVTVPPLSQPDEILNLARAQISGLTDPADITSALDAWIDSDAAGGFAQAAFHGNSDAPSTGVGPDVTLVHDVNALDPAIKTVLKGLILGALASEPSLGLSSVGKGALLGQAGQRMAQGGSMMTGLQAKIGMQQERIQEAVSRNAAEASALSLARSDMLSADPYETASALTQTEANLQNLYALTARMSRLSLTDYIK